MLQVLQDLNLHNGPFEDNNLLVTLDMVGLYTNIPHDDLHTLDVVGLYTNIPHDDLHTLDVVGLYTNIPHDDLHTLDVVGLYTNIPHDDLHTLDVVGLYTNISHDDLHTTLHHFLDNGTTSNSPPFGDLIHIMNHVLKNNVFEFDGEFFQQVFRTAMGTPMEPSPANLFKAWLGKVPSSSPGRFGGGSWMTLFYSGQTQNMN